MFRQKFVKYCLVAVSAEEGFSQASLIEPLLKLCTLSRNSPNMMRRSERWITNRQMKIPEN
jgi:hypothetical protein